MPLPIVLVALAAIVGVAILAATGGVVVGKIYRVFNPPTKPDYYEPGSRQAPQR
ncbi:hypothetical protein [Luteolibacter soli]|uniref:DUF3951 domain-containing protein n=1 Tax=Luteolibacter soli TaxID=3135280 RepID=A0ABU9AZR6_9BACT